jgi:hypothetical protein
MKCKVFIHFAANFVVHLHRPGFLQITYWQASQPGSSIAQNLMSVAALLICACAAAAAASSALMPPEVVAPDETALSLPDATVDFSAWVAEVVRR